MAKVDEDQQLNVRVPWEVAATAKRLAAKEGVPLSTFFTNLVNERADAEGEALVEQIEAEQAEAMRQSAALLAYLKERETKNESQTKRVRR